MAKTPKYPNPAFFRTKNNMDWKAQGENLKEVFDIAKDMLLATDWKAFGARQKQGWIDFGKRVAEEAAEIAAMSCAERRELLLKGEKKLGRLYKKGAMATVRREWRGVADTAYDFYEWLRIWGMLLGTFSKDLIPALNSVLHYRWMMSYLCCVGFMDKNTMGQRGNALKMSHLMTYDIFRYVAENLVFLAKCDKKNGNSSELNKKVVLFDEIEKAHPDVFNILLQVLDDGHITDAHGRKVDFKQTIIIMTSNVGAQAIIDPKRLGFGNKENQEEDYKRMKMNVMNEIKLVFRPEFLNRIDEILVFHPLGEPELKKITGMMCQEVVKRAKEQLDIHLTVRDSVKKLIMEKGTDKKYGARPLRRAVQSELEDSLAEVILSGEIKRGQEVVAGVSKKEIKFEVKTTK